MKEAYRDDLHLSKKNIERLHLVNSILEEYRLEGYTLTLRQLYYQLVSRDVIPNKQAEYKKLGNLLTKGRMAGVVDWDAIEDRVRVPKLPYWCKDIEDALSDTADQYRLNRQAEQGTYIEVWCEKDALSQVLYRVTSEYHVRLMVNRGYSSTTAMHDASKRFRAASRRGQDCVILYVGDHDPSGLDMLRDIESRLKEFGQWVEVIPVALTKEQIDEHNPPPNPAKVTDPRAGDYIAEHGNVSWEVDALPPQVLHRLIESGILHYIDEELYNEQIDQEEEDKKTLSTFAGVDRDELVTIWERLRGLVNNAKTKKAEKEAEEIADMFHSNFGRLLTE